MANPTPGAIVDSGITDTDIAEDGSHVSSAEAGREPIKRTTIDAGEIDKFSKIADEWWDPTGKFKPLHKFNPARLAFIRDAVIEHYGRDATATKPLDGLRLLDVGCGGGLVSEPMHRLGARVTGVDAAERNVKTASVHAEQSGLDIEYLATTAEDLAAARGPAYDVVLNLEAVEHVADVDLFLQSSAALVKPSGIMIVATINRTLKALATAKIGAEYVLGWLPRGTHDPRKFVKPEEIARALEPTGMRLTSTVGVSFNILANKWNVTQDPSVNYMVCAVKP
ncbi:MAG: bifunctional 2-polyprenyl-6-hydroxyphenol methylase/3-demethylubiquinol 3-O-methyltransferase UbiG [Pseudomonadota bacterium]